MQIPGGGSSREKADKWRHFQTENEGGVTRTREGLRWKVSSGGRRWRNNWHVTGRVLDALGKNEDLKKKGKWKVRKGGGCCRQQRALDQREGTNWEESQRVWKPENQAEGKKARKGNA